MNCFLFLSVVLPALACGGDDLVAPVPAVPSVAGWVRSSATGDGVAGASVSVGDATTTSGPQGRFELTGLSAGPTTLSITAAGFEDYQTQIRVPSGRLTQDFALTRIELFEFGDFALYAPAILSNVDAVLLALGGPDTRAFASGKPFGAPRPELEASLQTLGQDFRYLASEHGFAILGTSRAAMPNSPENDGEILAAIEEAATLSGRSELVSAPVVLYGISGGGPQASGFTARNPDRVAGLFLRVPAGVESLSGDALGVPTYMVLAELDAFVDNGALQAAFRANRGAGGLWAVATERGVPHHALGPAQRTLTVNWLATIMTHRLPIGFPPRVIVGMAESAGWLGDSATGEVASWAAYAGDRRSASWFATQAAAEEWKAFVAPR